MSLFFALRHSPAAACLMGSLFFLMACDDFVVGRGSRNVSGDYISNPSRAELERIERSDEKKYGPRVKSRTQKVIRDAETGQVVDPSLIPVEPGRTTGEIVTENTDVITQEIIDEPAAMNLKKKSKTAPAPVMEPVKPPVDTTPEEPAETRPNIDPKTSRPTVPPPAVERMVPELLEPPIPSNLR